jgi:hypothetical protein
LFHEIFSPYLTVFNVHLKPPVNNHDKEDKPCSRDIEIHAHTWHIYTSEGLLRIIGPGSIRKIRKRIRLHHSRSPLEKIKVGFLRKQQRG